MKVLRGQLHVYLTLELGLQATEQANMGAENQTFNYLGAIPIVNY